MPAKNIINSQAIRSVSNLYFLIKELRPINIEMQIKIKVCKCIENKK